MSFFDWHPGQPAGGTSQNCLLLHKPTDWNFHDAPCKNKYAYICEISN